MKKFFIITFVILLLGISIVPVSAHTKLTEPRTTVPNITGGLSYEYLEEIQNNREENMKDIEPTKEAVLEYDKTKDKDDSAKYYYGSYSKNEAIALTIFSVVLLVVAIVIIIKLIKWKNKPTKIKIIIKRSGKNENRCIIHKSKHR